ncbi:SRPBCC family protein [Streptomyces sp. NPDC051546]|uniref:SRPBCC family protein n=1 Tax=Streptomyces sp. NPDC051546 TaxID=3365655 RepID=UPI0037931CF5
MRALAQGVVSNSAETVWEHFAEFGTIAQWHPLIAYSILEKDPGPSGGPVRIMRTRDGELIREELITCDPTVKRLSYTFLSSPFPVTAYESEVEVTPTENPGQCHITWSATFLPDNPSQGPQLAYLFSNNVFQVGINALNAKHDKSGTETSYRP